MPQLAAEAALPGHTVQATFELGWDRFSNGRLLPLAETQFDVFLTVDKGIRHQQNFAGRSIAVITLRGRDNKIETHAPLMPQVLALLSTVEPGRVYTVSTEDDDSPHP